MKRILITLTLFFSVIAASFAQAPQKFSYQAVVRNESNTLVRGTVGVRVSILQGGVNGTVVYQETHTTTTNINGLMTLEIGGGAVLSGDFASIDWANGPYFLKTETDPDGGTNYTIEGTQQLLSVPYALYAGNAANSFSGSYNDLTDLPQMPDIPTNVSAFNNDAGYITMDSVPEIPTNVSAFVNDAGYVTESTLTNENYITQNDLITNNYVTSADIPTNVSAFTNDAGYITANDVPAYQVLSISNDTIFLSNGGYAVLPAGFDGDYNSLTNRPTLFSGDYNDLTNQPQIPQVPTNVSAFTNDAGYVTESMLTTENYITQNDLITNNYITTADIPTNVSAFTNDAGYITMDSIPAIPTVPTNVSAFTNDAGYVTESMLTTENYITQNDLITNNYITTADVPTNVSAFTNDAGYITMDSVPAIPTNVSAFTNDAGYVTESMLTTENYITQNDLITNNYVTEADIPTNVSAFTNDAGYITMDSVPAIPTNVSAFTNDVGYVTESMLTTENYITTADIPTNVSAFTNDAGYITMDSIPAIPTVPTNVSAFINDAGYLTSATVQEAANIPTNVSAFNNDAGYITMDSVPTIPTNVSAFTNDAGYVTESMLTTENYITQNDLITNNYVTTADIPTNVSAFTNDRGYITSASIPTNVSSFVNDRGYITNADIPAQVNADWNATSGAAQIMNKPDLFSGDYNDLTNKPTLFDGNYNSLTDAPVIPTNVSELNNDAGYITSYTEQQILSISNDTIYLTGGSFVKLPAGFSGSYNDLTEKPTLFDGNYNSLTDTPEIPVVNDAVLTIKQGGTTLGTFTANANAESTITIPEIAVPENVSTFTNDAGYLTRDSLENYNLTPADIQALLDRIDALEHSNAIPSVTTESIIPNGEGIIITGGNVFNSGTSAVTARGVCWGTNENPTIDGNHTSDGTGLGSFSTDINGLIGNTTYYIRAYATSAAGTAYGGQLEYSFISCGTATVSDADGNTYNTVLIGSQCWMKENLRTTKYADGTAISQGSSTSTTVGYWYYPDNSSSNKTTYGLLYNWKAVMRNYASTSANPSRVQGVCPTGWHVPSDAEWKQMEMAVGMSQSDADNTGWRGNIAAKLSGDAGWTSSSTANAAGNLSASGRNSSGFSALPAGFYYGSYDSFGNVAFFWSATEGDSSNAWRRYLNYSNAGVGRNYNNKYTGYSVRCVRD